MKRDFELRVRVRRQQHRDALPRRGIQFGTREGEGSSFEASGEGRRPHNLFVRLPRGVAVRLRESSSSSSPSATKEAARVEDVAQSWQEPGFASTSSWLGGWFRHGSEERYDAVEDVEFLPLRIEFRDRDGTPVVVYGSYNGGELETTTAGTSEEDRMQELLCPEMIQITEETTVPCPRR